MARTDIGTHTSDSLTTIAAALEAIADRLKRTAESMKEKGVTALEVKNQAGLKTGIVSLRSFGMAAEEALETWIFDQNVFHEGTGEEPAKAKPGSPGRKSKRQPEPQPEEHLD